MSRYDDIINLPHYESTTRKRMSMEQRAAQFAPFAALTGHSDAIVETARQTSEKPELSTAECEELSRKLNHALENESYVRITYFASDQFKSGGSLKSITGKIRGIVETEGIIVMSDKRRLAAGDVIDIENLKI